MVSKRGLSVDAKMCAVFWPNVALCSSKSAGPDLDPEAPVVIIPCSLRLTRLHLLVSCAILDYVEETALGAFHRCSSLVSVTIPNSVKQIQDSFFVCSLTSTRQHPRNFHLRLTLRASARRFKE